MLQTYRIVLHGNQFVWRGDVPEQIKGEQTVDVHLTILEVAGFDIAVMMRKALNWTLQ